MELKLEEATKRRHEMNNGEGLGDGKRRQQQRKELLPTVFQVDTVLGPGVDTPEARRTVPNSAVAPAHTLGNIRISLARECELTPAEPAYSGALNEPHGVAGQAAF